MLKKEDLITIRKLLDDKDYAGLEEYLDKQENNIYLKEAFDAMVDHGKHYYPNCGFCLLPDDQLLLSTRCSFFKLYSQDIFQIYNGVKEENIEPLRPIGDDDRGPKGKYLEWINSSPANYSKVTSIELTQDSNDSQREVYRIKSETDTIGVCVEKDVIDFANAVLGMNTNYYLEKEPKSGQRYTLKLDSKRGKGFVICI